MMAVAEDDMKLSALFDGIAAAPGTDVVDISLDSRAAVRGGLFLACAGERHHGLQFLPDALRAGIAAVAFEPAGAPAPAVPDGVSAVPVPALRSRLGEVADRFFASPSARLAVSGITGTNGKTTTAWLVALALTRLGRRAGYVGTLGHGLSHGSAERMAAELEGGDLTTPDCVSLHRRLRDFVEQGAAQAVLEVSSHALEQGRVDGVRFDTVAFTNLSRDHLDYHADLQSYAAAKARLFTGTNPRVAVINLDDEFGRTLAGRLPEATHLIGVSLDPQSPERPSWERPLGERPVWERRKPRSPTNGILHGHIQSQTAEGLRLQLRRAGTQVLLDSPLPGRFNAANLLLAAGILLAQGFSLEDAAAALDGLGPPPGRMERVGGGGQRPVVLVDFAHTPDALARALQALREHGAGGRVWCVFGCGGERDAGKRPLMGAVAATHADQVVLTSDNPRGEDPQRILADIRAGVPVGRAHVVRVEPDRARAIALAIREARAGDQVLIAGKGHERVQVESGVARPFADAAVARACLDATGGDA